VEPLPKEQIDEILQRLAAGETLRGICRSPGMPPSSTVRWCVVEDTPPGFAALYARARDIGLDEQAEQTIELSDNPRLGERVKRKDAGYQWICPKCEQECRWNSDHFEHESDKSALCAGVAKPDKRPLYETEVVTADMVERTRLQLDTRKWYLGKLAPRRYGDRLLVDTGSTDRLDELAKAVLKQADDGASELDKSEGE